MSQTQSVPIYGGKSESFAELRFGESESSQCEVEVVFQGARFVGRAEDYFDALVEVRKQLEVQGLLLGVYGASRNVWPSPMSRSMGAALKAYRMTLGQQSRKQDLVSIFESGPDVDPCTYAEQQEYKNAWFSSLGLGQT